MGRVVRQKGLEACRTTMDDAVIDYVIPLLDPDDPALKRTLRSFEKYGLLDIIRNVYVITNDHSTHATLAQQYNGLNVFALQDIDVPYDLTSVKHEAWKKLFAAPFIEGLADYYLMGPDDTILNTHFKRDFIYDLKKGLPYAHSFGSSRTGNNMGFRNIAPNHGPNVLNKCAMQFIIDKYKNVRPPIDPVSVCIGTLHTEHLLAGMYGYHDRRFRQVAGVDYFSECHTNGGCRRPKFDDLFVNIQGNGISIEYPPSSPLKHTFEQWFETQFPTPSRFEKRQMDPIDTTTEYDAQNQHTLRRVEKDGDDWAAMGRVVRKYTMKQTTCDIQRFTSQAANLWWIGNEQGKQWNPEWLDKSKKFAYVWWTSQSDYTWSALVAIKSLKSTNPSEQIDFVLIHTIALSDKQKQWLDVFGVKCISFENTVAVKKSYYKHANNKLYIFKLTQYAKVLFMDADSMPLQNLDHMFMFPDAPIVAPCSYWEPNLQPKFVSWMMLIMPNEISFNMLIQRASDMPQQPDMETLNDVFVSDVIFLPSYYGLLNSEWENDGNGAFHNHDKDIYSKVPIVHYTIKGKPWQHPKEFFRGDLWDDEANALHTRWWKFRDSLKISHGAPRCEQIRARAVAMVEDDGFVPTGDIDDMWIRDSAAQVYPLLDSHPALVRKVIEKQAFYIEFDPYANSYGRTFREPSILGRHGWVTTRNYELDSGAYFIRLVHAYWKRTGETLGAAAIKKLLHVWRVEQHHAHSLYRYDELQGGVGTPVGYTGMTWTGFRPSDDKCTYHYHIPDNVFAAVALGYVEEMGFEVGTLRDDIVQGIHMFGVHDGIYCYEVDGLGNCNKMDDANLPSLLSLPYLDPDQTVYDRAVWERTRAFVLSDANPYYYVGKYRGVGSPHTPPDHVWHLSLIVQAMQGDSEALQTLEETASEPGLKASAFHESFHVDNPAKYTRKWFAWADALYLELCH